MWHCGMLTQRQNNAMSKKQINDANVAKVVS